MEQTHVSKPMTQLLFLKCSNVFLCAFCELASTLKMLCKKTAGKELDKESFFKFN